MATTYARFTLQLNAETDADIIEYIKQQSNKNGLMKKALRFWIALEDEDVKK